MNSRNHYYLTIANIAQARGSDAALSWSGAGPADFAAALEEALHSPMLFERWRARQPEPDEVDPALGATDAQAQVRARVADLHVEVDVLTCLPMSLLRQRLNWLIGTAWQLHDVRPA
ncbi:hypothetical protein [Rhodanobacter sp. DHB23]|uniref:hypothetical protein n=1 Tax=Rhodanobacter sp. DHB23 TaxID=2775923 RepID=UPI00177B990B|nr:hypothetical protein [Rhodanobacter sp. DHB23]MBD8874226.1 hypothetical protein [Rhodanobacter sp. DHB23]